MQVLQEAQKSLESMGFSQLEPFNHRNLNILSLTIPGFISLLMHLIHEANSTREYMESIFLFTVCAGIYISFASTILITKQLFWYIEDLNEFINESELNLNRFDFEKVHLYKLNSKFI